MILRESLAQARNQLQAGKAKEAAALCHRILGEWPAQTNALHLLGIMAQQGGEGEAALDYVRRACAAPGAPAVYFSDLAEMCRQAGVLAEAEKAARHALSLEPALAGAWNNLGIILQEAGRYDESKACLERVLAQAPESPEAHNNFANTCKRLGLAAEAERHWLRALEARETYPEPHSNLAHLYSDLGAYDRAAYHARRAISLAPRFGDAYLNLALVETMRGDHAAALTVVERLLGFAPGHATGMAAKALALQQLDRLEEALPWARRAVAAAPANAEALYALAQISHALGDEEGARDAYGRATRQPGPAAQKAAGSLALLLMETGDRPAAVRAFDAAQAAYPRSATLYFNRADLKRYASAGDPDIAAMLALLDSADQAAPDRMLLRFALGNAFLQIGDGRQAFLHLNEGNRMKRASFSYDAATTTRWMAAIAAHFDAAALARLSVLREPADNAVAPVFVIGVPRSGTTLVEQVLASHPAVSGLGELSFMARAAKQCGDYPAFAASLTGAQLRRIGDTYMQDVRRRFGAALAPGHRYFVDKMPANFLYAGLIDLMAPNARIIHCRRDAVDTCLSCYSKLFTREQLFSYDLTELGQFHTAYQALMAHWRALLPADRFIEVEYEAVVADLEGQARRMLDFLGLPWAPSCAAFYRTARAVRTASVNQVRQPIYRGSVGRWKPFAPYLGPLLAALRMPAPDADLAGIGIP
jgi:tetratricopeptide (TPR) repeat protein